ncbi:MAG: hypothetical protein R6U26_02045 [Candidatus Undinarchaeales archaeon]
MKKIIGLFKFLEGNEIIRRYIIMNSFDGALTVLGIVIASFFGGITEPRLVVLPAFGAAVALLISGVWSAYIAEKAEVKKSVKKMEKHLMNNLDGTKYSERKHKMANIISLINGISPLLVVLTITSPFLVANYNSLPMHQAYLISFGLTAVLVFALGAFAGRIAKENRVIHGFKMLGAGVLIGFIFYILLIVGLL